MGVRFGLLISLATEIRRWMKCLRCHLKVIQNLIKYMPSFANMFLEFTIKPVILQYLVNLASFLY